MRKAYRVILLFFALQIVILSEIGSVRLEAEEPNVVNVLRNLGFTNIAESTFEAFSPGGLYNVTLYAEFADWHAENQLLWYPICNYNEPNLLFSGPEGNQGYVQPPLSKIFAANGTFGFSFKTPEGRTYYTNSSYNSDGLKHAIVYVNVDNPKMYFVGFENEYGVGDKDYDDFIFSIEFRSPSENIAGIHWFLMNSTSEKAVIYLDGGESSGGPGV